MYRGSRGNGDPESFIPWMRHPEGDPGWYIPYILESDYQRSVDETTTYRSITAKPGTLDRRRSGAAQAGVGLVPRTS